MKRGFCGGRPCRPPQNPPNSPSPLPLGGRGEGVRGRGEGPGAPKHHPKGCFKKAKLNKIRLQMVDVSDPIPFLS
jgi:hypothetical protein